MPLTPVSKRRKVMNFLTNYPDQGLTIAEAKNRFGIANLASTIRQIAPQVEAFGNWKIDRVRTPRGKVRYFMNDTHPGTRTYGFDREGNRFMLAD
jgi:hypothetical protein